ncbi:hypothetical protein FJT64_001225 [Amphibalanus amphitrite]|uniref:RNase H type-1 domain-containing protein n=1 Tax=Amphibalanus amphitrite TaxID=1232801 RepID=A0A6A4VFY2_AMPAM|nr:hypothetical protein FJT64_001225 [Amphibalanus amphitrite]
MHGEPEAPAAAGPVSLPLGLGVAGVLVLYVAALAGYLVYRRRRRRAGHRLIEDALMGKGSRADSSPTVRRQPSNSNNNHDHKSSGVTFRMDVGSLRAGAAAAEKERAAALHLASLPQCAVWLWTDGSAAGGVARGGAGAVLVWPDEEAEELRAPAGQLCSSYRAEMVALVTGLETLTQKDRDQDLPIVVCTDSLSAVATLRNGPAAQTSPLGERSELASSPSHGSAGSSEVNERLPEPALATLVGADRQAHILDDDDDLRLVPAGPLARPC